MGVKKTANAILEQQLLERDVTLEALKVELALAQERMRKQEDKKRREGQFQEGDWVYLKLKPYRQNRWPNEGMTSCLPSILDLIK